MIMLYLTGLCWENKAEVSLSLNFFNFKTWIFGVTLVSSVNMTFILLKLMSLICFFIKWISHLSCALKCIHKLFTITDVLPLVIKQSIINRVIISVLKKLLGSYQMFTWHHFAHSSINFALMNMAKTVCGWKWAARCTYHIRAKRSRGVCPTDPRSYFVWGLLPRYSISQGKLVLRGGPAEEGFRRLL